MNLPEAVNTYMYKAALGELRLMNKSIMSAAVSYNTMKYLDLISLTENCTVTKLASLLGISKPAVTMKVNELLRDGLVVKRQSAADKRVYYLEPGGAAAHVNQIYDRQLYKAAADAEKKYTKAELNSFCRILMDLASYFTWEGLADKAESEDLA